ncbi:MAG: MarR family winged helix-turn-helix transcriptional regulator [Acidimicrobiales bacterium]
MTPTVTTTATDGTRKIPPGNDAIRAHGPGTATGACAISAGRSLSRLSRLLELASASAGLTLAQYRVLVFLAQRPQRARSLAAKAEVQRSTLSAIVGGLCRGGLLVRNPVESDGRGVELELTDAGRSALRQVDATLAERLLQATSGTGVDIHLLAANLEALVEGLEDVLGQKHL